MNLDFEYILSVESIKEKHSHIICKFCNKPLVNPVLCEDCYNFMCQICPSISSTLSANSKLTDITNRCCGNNTISYLNRADDGNSFNGKGFIAKILDNLEIYCAVNKVNGCKWIGKRSDYLDHYRECNQMYCECVYGCGQIVDTNDIYHLDSCEAFNKWSSVSSIKENDKKMATYMHYTKIKIQDMQNQIKMENTLTDHLNNKIKEIQNEIRNYDNQIQEIENKIGYHDNQFFAMQHQNHMKTIKAIYEGNIIADAEKPEIILAKIVLPDIDAIWSINIFFKSEQNTINKHNETYDDAMKKKRGQVAELMCSEYGLPFCDYVDANNNFNLSKAAFFLVGKQNGSIEYTRGCLNKKYSEILKEHQAQCDHNYQYITIHGYVHTNTKISDYKSLSQGTITSKYDASLSQYQNPTTFIITKGQPVDSRTMGISFVVPKIYGYFLDTNSSSIKSHELTANDLKNHSDKEIFFTKHENCNAIIVANQIG
jgi:hypothetical protein